MKTHARVAIVGGGIYGVSLAYFLAEYGWKDVVLIEKGELTSGQTWHAAGFVTNYAFDVNTMRINDESVKLYKKLAEDPETDPGWVTSGTLRLIYDKMQYDGARSGLGWAEQVGVNAEIVSPARAKELMPFLNEKPLLAAMYTPDDGSVDPARVTNAIAMLARRNGVDIYRHTRVTAIDLQPNNEWKLNTTKGDIIAEHVVNAGGFWMREVGEMVGANIPVTTLIHQYVITEALPEVVKFMKGGREFPTLRDSHAGMYMRREQQGICIGTYETSDAQLYAPEGLPWSFDTQLLEDDIERLLPFYERAAETVPLFANAGLKTVITAPQIFSASGQGFMGRIPGLPNCWAHSGSSIGITQGGGAGKMMAQYMTFGEADINMSQFDPANFGRYADRDYTQKRAKRAFERLFLFHAPYEEPHGARPTYQDPIYGRLEKAGASFGEAYGWERANWFLTGDGAAEDEQAYRHANFTPYVAAECKAVHEGVGVISLSHLSKVEVSGKDAQAFLNSLTAKSVPAAANKVTHLHYLNPKGNVIAEHTVTRRTDGSYYVLFASTACERDFGMLKLALKPGMDVTLKDRRREMGALLVTGPKSRELLSRITDADLSNEAFPWLSAAEIKVVGIDVFALRVSYVGELGWELHTSLDTLAALYDAIFEAGKDLGVVNFGARALNSMRLEKGYRDFGAELNERYSLDQAGMGIFASMKKDSYVGRDAVVAERAAPRKKKLAYLKVEAADNDAWGDEVVYFNGKRIGATTSGGYGYRVNSSIAFALIDAEYAVAGAELQIRMLGDLRAAVVCDEALYDPKNEKLKM